MKSDRIVYGVVAFVLLLLAGVALFSYHGKKETEQANVKAQQLQTALSSAGLRVPYKDSIVRVLGDDGGAICADPDDALRRGTLYGMITNGAAGPGQRPVLVDNKILQGQLIIMKVYCPQYADAFQDLIDDLKDA
ncbi:hypothetical protein Acy02nite_51580 [Actinoplanes cyaneus]|uniref:Uncharacterized protein n=1 Tax=Actinoplanes cyaneus TaxID=52696 RepID=A0A919IMY1_9ACTN|nr:hypothetical protein [Actinoplanes cyaneus]MCW2141211.1 hypothetical protein [Actinoplanes cyaneus]GID67277.1 hypothetical protein Acy02nite_51580 [Actinoplanes cyaneus]